MENKSTKTLITPYFEKMDKQMPWNEYPRPSMVRDSFICLNGSWDFAITKEESAEELGEKILVPFPPESLLSGIKREVPEDYYMHYKRSFSIPEGFMRGRVLLHFGAVDNICQVFLNGRKVGEHFGGYLPFSIDITDELCQGENELYVRAQDDLSGLYPYGKQTRNRGGMWYTPVSGIWQTVWLESVPEKYIEKLIITPSMSQVKIQVVGGESEKTIILEGKEYEFTGESITLVPEEIKLWSPENPHLYNFTLKSGEDSVEGYFALREIGIKDVNGIPRLTLNGKPYLFNGLLDQGYYPDGIFLPATSEGFEDDIRRMKEYGFNTLRKHIKVEPEIFYNLCDRLGMIVFQDMVNNSKYSFFFDTALPTVGFKGLPDRRRTKPEMEQFEKDMYGTMEHLYSFPCILYYTVFNEGWGQFKADIMYEKAKKKDPTRIIDATSGWFKHKKSDVDSRHVYFRAVKVKKAGNRPIVISEFGGYSHRVEGHLFSSDNYGYTSHANREEFENAFLKLYGQEIEPLISKGICALIYTQVSDVEDETNGLLTYDRQVEKLDKARVRQLMQKLYDTMNSI